MTEIHKAITTRRTLMIVEDEALVAIVLRDVLTEAGYIVLDFTTRHVEALEVARRPGRIWRWSTSSSPVATTVLKWPST